MGDEASKKQPRPQGRGPSIGELVMEDIATRMIFGKEVYGEALKAFNGRDALVDAYQEVLDLSLYLKQEIMERYAIKEMLMRVIHAFVLTEGEWGAFQLGMNDQMIVEKMYQEWKLRNIHS